MAEADELILCGLRAAGIDVGDTSSLRDFDGEAFFRACSSCVHLVKPTACLGVPASLPGRTAARFKACSALCKAITECGYPVDVGFSAFMYANVEEARRVLAWLVGALPAAEEAPADPSAARAVLDPVARGLEALRQLVEGCVVGKRRTIRPVESAEAAAHRLPVAPAAVHTVPIDPFHRSPMLALCPQCPNPPTLALSLLEFNAARAAMDQGDLADWERWGIHTGVSLAQYRAARAELRVVPPDDAASHRHDTVEFGRIRRSRVRPQALPGPVPASRFLQEAAFVHTAARPTDTVPEVPLTGEEAAAQREEEETLLRETLRALETRRAELDGAIAKAQAGLEAATAEDRAAAAHLQELQRFAAELEAEYETQQRTIEYADDLEGNTARLEADARVLREEMGDIRTAFEEKEGRYRAQCDALEGERSGRRAALAQALAEGRRCRRKAVQLTAEIQAKEEQRAALAFEYQRLPKTVDRELFLGRIMDIVKNIRKQQAEVAKIHGDNTALQKDINHAAQAVTRSFIATEEGVYRDAAKDAVAKQVYRQLVVLREHFDALIAAVEQIGHQRQQQHELEGRKSALAQRDEGLGLNSVQGDLAAVRAENAELSAALKAARAAAQ
jgi:hypothetical protein